MAQALHKKRGTKGFTLIELMIVIAIIGILAAIAIPQFSAYRAKGFNTAAMSSVKNAYKAAQAFFSDSPGGTVDAAKLSAYGFTQEASVAVTIGAGTQTSLSITASHTGGGSTFTINNVGTTSP